MGNEKIKQNSDVCFMFSVRALSKNIARISRRFYSLSRRRRRRRRPGRYIMTCVDRRRIVYGAVRVGGREEHFKFNSVRIYLQPSAGYFQTNWIQIIFSCKSFRDFDATDFIDVTRYVLRCVRVHTYHL